MTPAKTSTSPWLALVPWAFVLLWSTGFIGAKYGLPYIEPFNFLFIRMLLTLVVFAILIGWQRTPWPSWAQARQQMLVGALVHGLYLGGVFAAIKTGLPAGMTAIIVGLQPLLTAVIARYWLAERLTSMQLLGFWLGLLGVILVVLGRQAAAGAVQPAGILWALAALLGICAGTLYQKRYGGKVPLLTGTFWQYCAAALMMGLMTWSTESGTVIWSTQLLLAMAWLVLGLSLTAILLLMVMIREGESARVASYFYLVPPLTTLEGWLLFNEHLSLLSVCGVGLTAVAVWLAVARATPA